MIKKLARLALAGVLHRFGYRLVDCQAEPTGLAAACEELKRRGFSPSTVIDVGVGPGTPWLYAAFPSARFELFEPIASFRSMIEQGTAALDVGIHFCALGEQRSRASIEIDSARPTSSTMARYSDRYIQAASGSRPTTTVAEVDVFTLDEFGPFKGPTLIKLDVEGYEGHVVRGATRTLKEADVVISEVSVARRTDSELSLGGFLSLMESLGFSLMDIAEIHQIGRGGPIAYMDVVLVRSDSPMRYGAC